MHVSLDCPSEPKLERLVSVLGQLCEREGLDPCQTACVIIEGLAWMPHQPRARNSLPHVAESSRFEARMVDLPEMIQQRAYEIWQAEGQPDGRALEHWRRAEAELRFHPAADHAPNSTPQEAPHR